MGDFTNGVVSRIFATLLSFLVITINIYFVVSYVIGEMPTLYRTVHRFFVKVDPDRHESKRGSKPRVLVKFKNIFLSGSRFFIDKTVRNGRS
jgi:hypothetical protein